MHCMSLLRQTLWRTWFLYRFTFFVNGMVLHRDVKGFILILAASWCQAFSNCWLLTIPMYWYGKSLREWICFLIICLLTLMILRSPTIWASLKSMFFWAAIVSLLERVPIEHEHAWFGAPSTLSSWRDIVHIYGAPFAQKLFCVPGYKSWCQIHDCHRIMSKIC